MRKHHVVPSKKGKGAYTRKVKHKESNKSYE
jgi:stalled ribosome alternative rescue factor ArfA